jgi:hypothetical protein
LIEWSGYRCDRVVASGIILLLCPGFAAGYGGTSGSTDPIEGANTQVTLLLSSTAFSSFSNANVTQYPGVADCVTSVLLATPSVSCLNYGTSSEGTAAALGALIEPTMAEQQQNETIPYSIQESPEEFAERSKLRFKRAPERLSVKAPEGDVPLGNPVEIELTFAPGKLAYLSTGQFHLGLAVNQGSGPAKIVRDEGNKKTIEIVPAQLGSVDLEITATYSDNALAGQTIHLNVVPSAKHLKRFQVFGGGETAALILEDAELGHMRLNPYVTYENFDYPIGIDIPDCEQIKFSVEQPDDEAGYPAVEMDKGCLVRALREGKAVIVGNFDGIIGRVKITVYSKEDARARLGYVRQ